MERKERDELAERLEELGADVLARFLVAVADADAAMRERVEGLALQSDPPRLAQALRRRLTNIKRGSRFIPYKEAAVFSTRLDGWLEDLERGLLASAPESAAELLGAFIKADASIVNRVDSSGGELGMVFGRACRLWMLALSRLPRSFDRVARVHELHAGNDYGVRDALLDEVALALDELELRRLARHYEDALTAALAAPRPEPRSLRRHSPRSEGLDRYSAAAAMGQVACALADAKLYERSVRIHSPEPNALQGEDIARNYLRFGPVEMAIEWLDKSGSKDIRLRAKVLEKLGDPLRLRDARKQPFEQTLDADDLNAYLALLSGKSRADALREAVTRASADRSPTRAARLLLTLDQADRAEAVILDRAKELEDAPYTSLQALAKTAAGADRPLAATLCFRALTNPILDEGNSKAYGHARKYCAKLEQLDAAISDHRGLPDHGRYMAGLREQHGRKHAFWRLFGNET